MKQFDEKYRTGLYKTISGIENNSLAEIVVIVKPRSENYFDASLWFAATFMIAVYTFFMFSPIDFNVFLIYGFTILSFFLAYYTANTVDALKKLFIKKSRMSRSVEITARALFQKGGIHNTNAKIGVLIYCSYFEKIVYVLPDSGAEKLIPEEEWTKMRTDFQTIFAATDIATALTETLARYQPVFTQYIPPVPNDINEIPDDLTVDL